MAVSENPNRGAKYVPYIWLVYLAALFVQPAFDPSAGVLDWLAVAVLIAIFLPLYRAAVRTSDQRRLMMLIAAFVLLAVIGSWSTPAPASSSSTPQRLPVACYRSAAPSG